MSGTVVIGGAGFLAGHLIPELVKTRHVTAIDVVPAEGATRIKSLIESKQIDYSWKSVIDLNQDDLVGADEIVYLAAQADVPLAIKSPMYTFQQNVMSTLNFMETVRKLPILPKVIYMSSESVYGVIPFDKQPIKEDVSLNPTNAYAASKASAEIVVRSYAAQYDIPTMVLRSTTMYGPASRAKQVVPIFMRQALANKDITVEGDGSQSRDFNYVKNNVSGILKAMANRKLSGTYNLGSGVELTIKELAEKIIKIAGSPSKVVNGPWRAGEKGIKLNVDISKAKADFGYEPIYTVEQGLTETIDWIRKNG